MVHPKRNMQLFGGLHGLLPHRLPQAQRHSRRNIGDILAQDEHGVGGFHFAQRRRTRGTVAQNVQHQLQQPGFSVGNAGIEPAAPTSDRNAKLLSSDARGEPMPIAFARRKLSQ